MSVTHDVSFTGCCQPSVPQYHLPPELTVCVKIHAHVYTNITYYFKHKCGYILKADIFLYFLFQNAKNYKVLHLQYLFLNYCLCPQESKSFTSTLLDTSFKFLLQQYFCFKQEETTQQFHSTSYFKWSLFYIAEAGKAKALSTSYKTSEHRSVLLPRTLCRIYHDITQSPVFHMAIT